MESQRMNPKNWYNVLVLGFGFFLLFSAFQTSAFVQTITINSFLSPKCRNLSNGTDTVVDGGIHITENFANKIGYYSLCIIYFMVALGNWASVSIVAVVGPKLSLIVSGCLYVVYIAALIRPYVPTIFIGAFILGAGGGVLWTAQGQILIQNSSTVKMPTTSGIFWFMLESSLVFGNLFLFILLYSLETGNSDDDKCIPHKDNYIIFGVLTVIAVAGVITFAFIRPVTRPAARSDKLEDSLITNEDTKLLAERSALPAPGKKLPTFLQAIVDALKILFTVDMFLLSICFVYTGYELNFWSGVYGTVVGNTQKFDYYNIGLAGLFIGIGEIVGGGLFGILGHYTNKWGRDPIVLLGMLTHFVTFLLVFYNLPSEAISDPVTPADSKGYLFDPSIIYLVMLCAFLLGFGDSCYNTQIYSLLGVLYPTDDRSAPAMALFKFFQSMATMVGFLTSALIELQWQLLVLTILATVGTLSFAIVEWKHYGNPAIKLPGKADSAPPSLKPKHGSTIRYDNPNVNF